MRAGTVLRRWSAAARAPDPLWVFAAVLVLAEAALAAAGVRSVALAAAAVVAPGWALAPVLPGPLRRWALTRAAAGPAFGVAVSAIALVWISWLGIPLTGVSVRIVLVLLVAVGLGTWAPADRALRRPRREEVLEAVGLVGALVLGLVLAQRVMGSGPAPGNDWAKYLLYADEIRRHGALLIDNPFWMLGVPFREDPGVPALYGAVLLLSRAPAAVLMPGIVVLTLVEIAAAYAFARAFWGRAAGVLTALLLAAVPSTQDMLGWHGLANVGALGPMALGLAVLATFAADGLGRRDVVGAAIVCVGIAAVHRLSFLVMVGAAGLVLLLVVVRAARARAPGPPLRQVAAVAALAALGGLGVWADLYERQKTFGGTQGYTAYLATKIDIDLAIGDVSPVLAYGAVAALVLVALRRRRDRALWPPIAMLLVSVALGYAWLVHVPTYYARMVFYVPLAAAPILAAVTVRLRPRLLVAAVAAVALAVTVVGAAEQAPKVRAFYMVADPAAIRGLQGLAARLRPDEVVATDRCWSFLGTWLLRTRTLPALTPQDIQPKAELRIAREAQSVLDGTPAGRAAARRLGVRYAIVDPTCTDARGALLPPPTRATVVYASDRLAVVRLPWVAR